MKRWITVALSLLILVLLLTVGALIYLYSDAGNTRLRTYLEQEIQRQTHLPITFNRFRLTRGHLYFVAVMGREASLGFDGSFDLFHRRLDGRYLLKASHARYQTYTLRQANISGEVHGTIDNLRLQGKGTLLDAPTSFRLKIRERIPQDIIVQLRKLPLDELMRLGGQPPLIQGQLNVDVVLPAIGKKGSHRRAILSLSGAHFDAAMIRKLYGYTLPKDKTALQGKIEAHLNGMQLTFDGDIISTLLTIHLNNGQANIEEKSAACDARIEATELSPVTQDWLHGPFKLVGSVKHDELGTQLQLQTHSLGGTIQADYAQTLSVTLKDVTLGRLFHLVGQPQYGHGKLGGTLRLTQFQPQSGQYRLKITDGKIDTKLLNQQMGTSLPPRAIFTLNSRGTYTKGVLSAAASLRSNLIHADMDKIRFTAADKTLSTHYRVRIPNPLLLAGKRGKGVPVRIEGTAIRGKSLQVKGDTFGLGKRLSFDYGDNRLSVLANGVILERLLSSFGLPTYVSGKVDALVDLTSLYPIEGRLSLDAPQLTTHPDALKRIMGTPLNTAFGVTLNAEAKRGILYGMGRIQSPFMRLTFPKMSWDVQHTVLKSPFKLILPNLAKLQPLIGTKLSGKLVTDGSIYSGKEIDLKGATSSLGGSLTYRMRGTQVNAALKNVSLPKLLRMIDQPDPMRGTIHGTIAYNTFSRRGDVRTTLDRFQFKPSKLTSAVKVVLRKDLTQVIYDHTSIDADIHGDAIAYRLKANGGRSDFAIRDGKLNTKAQTNKASFGLRVDSVDVIGTIRGAIRTPKITVLPGKLLRNRIKKKVIQKVAPTLKKVLKKQIGSSAAGALIKKIPKLF